MSESDKTIKKDTSGTETVVQNDPKQKEIPKQQISETDTHQQNDDKPKEIPKKCVIFLLSVFLVYGHSIRINQSTYNLTYIYSERNMISTF